MGTTYIALADDRKEIMMLDKTVVLYHVAQNSDFDDFKYENESLIAEIERCVKSGYYYYSDGDYDVLTPLQQATLERILKFRPTRIISEHHGAYYEFDESDDGNICDYKITNAIYASYTENIGMTWKQYLER